MDRDTISKVMSELARKGAKKRIANISPERRKEIARKAAKTRWKAKKQAP